MITGADYWLIKNYTRLYYDLKTVFLELLDSGYIESQFFCFITIFPCLLNQIRSLLEVLSNLNCYLIRFYL